MSSQNEWENLVVGFISMEINCSKDRLTTTGSENIDDYAELRRELDELHSFAETPLLEGEPYADRLELQSLDLKRRCILAKLGVRTSGNPGYDWMLIGFHMADKHFFSDVPPIVSALDKVLKSAKPKLWTDLNIRRAGVVDSVKNMLNEAISLGHFEGKIYTDASVVELIHRGAKDTSKEFQAQYEHLRVLMKLPKHVYEPSSILPSIANGRGFRSEFESRQAKLGKKP
ncbi:MAG: hypothetical protein ACSHX3_01765 [Litorimonas sp.]